MMDFEDQWKEEFLRNYLDAMKGDPSKGKQPKPSIGMLEALKKKLKW